MTEAEKRLVAARLDGVQAEIMQALVPITRAARDSNLVAAALAVTLGKVIGMAWQAGGEIGPVAGHLANAEELVRCGLHAQLARAPGVTQLEGNA